MTDAPVGLSSTSYLYKEVLPPSGVTHATRAYLTHLASSRPDAPPEAPNLVVIKSTRLELYIVRNANHDDSTSRADVVGNEAANECYSLELVSSCRLNGVVQDVAVLRSRVRWSQRDALMLTFRDAKVSVLEWSIAQHELRYSSLHYLEGDAILRSGLTSADAATWSPRIVTDPEGRCAAAALYHHQLALFPAMQSLEMDLMADGAAASGSASAAQVGNSYVLDLAKLPNNNGIRDIRDLAFLYGTGEPLLLVLHEVAPTWAGRLRDRRDTMALTAISISTSVKRHPVIWTASGLPHDAFRVVPLPQGPGALVLSPGLVMYFTQKGTPLVVCVDGRVMPGVAPPRPETMGLDGPAAAAARIARDFVENVHPDAAPALCRSAIPAPGVQADISCACTTWLSPTSCLLALRSGQLLAVQLSYEGTAVAKMQVVPVGWGSVCCSATVALNDRLLFLGAWAGDSRLLAYRAPMASNDVADAPVAKRRRLQTDASAGDVSVSEDAWLRRYASSTSATSAADGDDSDEEVMLDASGPTSTPLPAAVAAAPPAGVGSSSTAEEDATATAAPWEMCRLDRLPAWGPLRDVLYVDLASPAEGAAAGADSKPNAHVFACCGEDASGSLLTLRRAVVTEMVTDVELTGVTGMWAVHQTAAAQPAAPALEQAAGDGDASPSAAAEADGKELVVVPAAADEGHDAAAGTTAASRYHAYLLLSRLGTSTQVLETGEELQEVTERTEFVTDQPTVCAGNLLEGSLVCQVCPQGVRLVDRGVFQQHLDVQQDLLGGACSSDECVLSASISDPYVLLRLHSGAALLLVGDASSRSLRVCSGAAVAAALAAAAAPSQHRAAEDERPHEIVIDDLASPNAGAAGGPQSKDIVPFPEATEEPSTRHLAASCLYHDEGCWLGRLTGLAGRRGPPTPAARQGAHRTSDGSAVASFDFEEPAAAAAVDALDERPSALFHADEEPSGSSRTAGRHYLVLVGRRGRLDIFHLPSMKRVFSHSSLPSGQRVLSDQPHPLAVPYPVVAACAEGSDIVEIRFEAFTADPSGGGAAGLRARVERPVLVALDARGRLLIYQAFASGQRELSFVRLLVAGDLLSSSLTMPPADDSAGSIATSGSRMARFEHVAGAGAADSARPYSGIFICGPHPVWLVASRGGLVAHPLASMEGAVAAMTPFHNVNCTQGFILSKLDTGVLRICQLPPGLNLDTPWTIKRTLMKSTPHRLAWVPDLRVLATLVAVPNTPHRPRLPEEPGGDAAASAAYAAADAAAKAAGSEEAWEVRVVDPVANTVMWRAALAPGEVAVSVRYVNLRVSPSDTVVPFLAVGTSASCGEDYPCNGRILLYRLSHGVSDLGDGATQAVVQGALACTRDCIGPITSVADFKGFLMLSVGNKLELYIWNGRMLTKSAFWDAPLLITSVDAVKEYLLVTDVHKGMFFINYRERERQFRQWSKQYDQNDVVYAKVLVNHKKILFVCGDAGGTLHAMDYDMHHEKSYKGERMVHRGALHLGHTASRFCTVPLANNRDGSNRQVLLMGTLEGGLGCVTPVVDAGAPGRLVPVVEAMAHWAPQAAGLNPRAFRRRYAKLSRALGGGERFGPPLMGSKENALLDGDLLWQFFSLTYSQQVAFAVEADSSVEQLLVDIEQLALHMAVA